MNISQAISQQRIFFSTGVTLSYSYRRNALNKLKNAITSHEQDIFDALRSDLGKSDFESYMSEVGLVLEELSFAEKHLKKWVKPIRKKTPLAQFHAKSFMYSEPYGCVLLMSPWNYPFMLSLTPLIGAICAGNCVTIKPSAYSSAVSAVIKKIISSAFDETYINVIEGGRRENSALLEEKFDFIFFTGSVSVGGLVMEKASKHLTPVILELGGKSPCIVDETADIKIAAKRIAFGKYLNCGQTCVAPDYLLIHQSVEKQFLKYFVEYITEFFGDNPLNNPNYGHIINDIHYTRILNLIKKSGEIYFGGESNDSLQISPTVLTDVKLTDPVMKEEIFGPVLPVIPFSHISQAIDVIKSYPKPLSLYLFTQNKQTENKFLTSVSFGGGCINDTLIHLATPHMSFGGVGDSGMGGYHGHLSFKAFSHEKSIVKKYTWFDLNIRYHPYSSQKFKILRKFMK